MDRISEIGDSGVLATDFKSKSCNISLTCVCVCTHVHVLFMKGDFLILKKFLFTSLLI